MVDQQYLALRGGGIDMDLWGGGQQLAPQTKLKF